jgi:hypothetical protein
MFSLRILFFLGIVVLPLHSEKWQEIELDNGFFEEPSFRETYQENMDDVNGWKSYGAPFGIHKSKPSGSISFPFRFIFWNDPGSIKAETSGARLTQNPASPAVLINGLGEKYTLNFHFSCGGPDTGMYGSVYVIAKLLIGEEAVSEIQMNLKKSDEFNSDKREWASYWLPVFVSQSSHIGQKLGISFEINSKPHSKVGSGEQACLTGITLYKKEE